MKSEGHEFKVARHIPKLMPPNPIEIFWLTTKSLLLIASDKDRERLGF